MLMISKKSSKILFLLCLFISLFYINKVSALTNKGYGQVNWTTSNEHAYTINGVGVDNFVFRFDALTNDNDYDFIGFRANPLYYVDTEIEDLPDTWCNEWTAVQTDNSWGSDHEYRLQRLYCSHQYGTTSTVNPSFTSGQVGFSAFIGGGGIDAEPCFYTKEYEGILLCPFKTGRNYLNYYANNYDSSSNYMTYKISISNMVLFYNNDTSELVHVLEDINDTQNTTNTYIQNFNNFVSNNDTTTAQTNGNNALSGISNIFNAHMSRANELTQFFLIPINFIINISSDTC